MKEWRYGSMHSKLRNYTKLNGKTSFCGERGPGHAKSKELYIKRASSFVITILGLDWRGM
jgi:hypothetical protein